mmetsp:Transcript_102789/g.291061  ORF Transcript_102789/g.291061 Transcript_102789/m.291061 type:complete len:160 (+) Transcript_102789:93-572(+)
MDQQKFSSSILSGAARQTLTPRSTSLAATGEPRTNAAYRPVAGKPGIVCPGAQHWHPPQTMGNFSHDDLVSTATASYQKRPEIGLDYEKSMPLTTEGHGIGSGYCPNTVSIRGVDWNHKQPLDTFRTTYGDTLAPGWRCPKAPSTPRSCAAMRRRMAAP